MQHEFVFSGFGGQGVMFVGQLLAYTAMDAGLYVTWIPSYGPEMRGGTAHCFIVVSDKPVGSPIVRYPEIGVAFNLPSFEKYESMTAPGGLLVKNTSLIDRESDRTDIEILSIPATTLADDLGDTRVTNLILLGAMLNQRPIFSLDELRESLSNHIPAHRRNLLDLNYQAINQGAAYAEKSMATLP